MLQKQATFYTPEEYLALEEKADYKSEIFAMAGGSYNHNRIAGNINAVLNFTLEKKACDVFGSDMRLLVKQPGLYTYPDVMVICGQLELVEDRTDTVTNPQVIVEVLSKSTQNYDRGFKFEAYRTIPTFLDYMLIDQERIYIEYFHKLENGQWLLTEFKSASETLSIKSLDLEIPIGRIYHKVDWFVG